MTIILAGVAGATDYEVEMYPYDSPTIEGSAIALTEGVAGTFYSVPTGKPANLYVLIFKRGGSEVGRATYEWNGVAEATNTNILLEGASSWVTATGFTTTEPDNAGIAELTALLTTDNSAFTGTALQNAPTGSGGGSGLTPDQATQLSTLFGLVNAAGDAYTQAALANTPNPASSGGLQADERTKLLGLNQPPELTDIASAVNSARDAVLAEGALNWVTATGFATVNPDNAGISSIDAKLTTARAEKLDRDLSTLTQINSARDSIISAGNAWVTATGFATTEPDNAGIAELTALLTNDNRAFTSIALQNAPTGSGSGSGLTPDQAIQLSTLFGLVNAAGDAYTAAALANAPSTSAGGGLTTDERNKLLGLNQPPALVDIESAIHSARDAVIAEGSSSWVTATGFATVNPDNATITAIDAAVSTLPASVNSARDAVIAEGSSSWQTATGFATTEPDNAGIAELRTSVSAIPTTNTITAISTAVNSARDLTISAGDGRWRTATGFATGQPPTVEAIAQAVDDKVSADLASILSAAQLAALSLDADTIDIDEDTAIASYTKDGVVVNRYALFGSLGEPNANIVRRQVKLS